MTQLTHTYTTRNGLSKIEMSVNEYGEFTLHTQTPTSNEGRHTARLSEHDVKELLVRLHRLKQQYVKLWRTND